MEPRILTVPMNPEFFPETALLLGGVIAGILALRHLFAREPGPTLRVGGIAVACIVLALFLGRSGWIHSNYGRQSKPMVLLPASTPSPDEARFMSLALGDVILRVAPSERYVLSVEGKRFLTLDAPKSGMSVTCDLADDDGRIVGRIRRNTPERYPVRTSRPDTHTMLLQDAEGHEIFGVRYLGPTQVQITGSFHAAGLPEPVLVSTERGVHWKGGGVPPGTRIDLTPQGKGRIDFERSGLIRVLP